MRGSGIKMQQEKAKIEKINLFIPELDAEINKIEYPFKDQEYFIVEFSLYQSLGEWGEYYTEFYDTLPTIEELKKDLREYLLKQKEEYENSILGGREENYLKILNKIAKGHKFKPILETL